MLVPARWMHLVVLPQTIPFIAIRLRVGCLLASLECQWYHRSILGPSGAYKQHRIDCLTTLRGKYVLIQLLGSESLNLQMSEIVPLTNAVDGTALQLEALTEITSSGQFSSQFLEGYAFDEIINKIASQSGNAVPAAWIQFEFAGYPVVTRVYAVTRIDCCVGRFDYVDFRVANDTLISGQDFHGHLAGTFVNSQVNNGEVYVIYLDNPKPGRFFSIAKKPGATHKMLDIAELILDGYPS